jgi:RimJ/RimL family protein N-acetyltransferase
LRGSIGKALIATLNTTRLLLRPLQLADAQQTQRLFPHWEIVKYLNTQIPWPYPADGALTYYRDVALPAMERGEEWHWTLRLKQAPEEHVGNISLFSKNGHASRGFWLGLPWHGRGLMTEAVVAVNDYCFDELGFSVLRVPKATLNLTSRRISEKTGMRVIARVEHPFVCGPLQAEIWELTADEWRKQRKEFQDHNQREE